MMYSCAIWSDAEGGVRGDLINGAKDGDLEAAQERKVHTILAKARVRPGDRLLEIGSGWGPMAIGVKPRPLAIIVVFADISLRLRSLDAQSIPSPFLINK